MATYQNLHHLKSEFRGAVKPYKALLTHELRSADYTKWWYEQEFTTPRKYAEAYECDHQNRRPVLWTLSNGVERVTLQCVACGDKYSTGVKKSDYDTERLPDLDEDLIKDAREAEYQFLNELSDALEDTREAFEAQRNDLTELERLAQDKEWWDRYTAYLRSPEWQLKRKKVLERDGFVCQACLRREAVHAHHLTYEMVFDEPLFHLTSVCVPCHVRLHPHMVEEEAYALTT